MRWGLSAAPVNAPGYMPSPQPGSAELPVSVRRDSDQKAKCARHGYGAVDQRFDTCGGLVGFGVDPQPRPGVDRFGEAHRGCGQVRWMGAHGLGRDPGCDTHRGQPVQDRPTQPHGGRHGWIDVNRMHAAGEPRARLPQALRLPLRSRSAPSPGTARPGRRSRIV